jgi:hypothetical protein
VVLWLCLFCLAVRSSSDAGPGAEARLAANALGRPGTRRNATWRGNCVTGERPPTDVLTGSPGLGQTRHGVAPDGAACKGGRMHWGAWATQAAPRSSRQSDLVAVLPIVTHTPTPPHVAFVRAPTDDSSHQTEPASRTHEKGVRPLFKRVDAKHVKYAPSPRLHTSTHG